MKRIVLLFFLLSTPCFAQVVGHWGMEVDGARLQLLLADGGTYQLNLEAGGSQDGSQGTYSVSGNRLILVPEGEPEIIYTYQLDGQSLRLAGGDLDEPMTLLRMGSAPTATSQAPAAPSGTKSFAPIKPGATVTIGTNLPADTASSRVFAGAQGFTAMSSYFTFAPVDVTYENGSSGRENNTKEFWFFPNGRAFGRLVTVQRPQNVVGQTWGRYKVAAGGEIFMEGDSGETFDFRLINGERQLQWGENILDDPIWAASQL